MSGFMWVILHCTPESERLQPTLCLVLASSFHDCSDLEAARGKLLAVVFRVVATRECPPPLSPLSQPYQCAGDVEKMNLVEQLPVSELGGLPVLIISNLLPFHR